MENKKRVPSRSDSKALQEQSLRMEERLRELKTMMAKEKAKREKSNGMFWKSGQKGALQHHKEAPSPQKSSAASSTKRPARIRVLTESNIKKDVEQSRAERTAPLREEETPVMVEDGGEGRDERGNSCHLPPPCGQCEDQRASLFCVECEERYCESCYVAFHHRGALTKHHAQPLSSDRSNSTVREVTMASSKLPHVVGEGQWGGEHTAPGMGGSGSLLEGTFNEDESTASFQAALMAWRKGDSDQQGEEEGKQAQEKGLPPALAATATQSDTPPSSSRPPVGVADCTSAPSLSYLDRMLIRKHRTDPFFLARHSSAVQPMTQGPTQDSSSSNNAEGFVEAETSHQPSQYNLFYSESDWTQSNVSECRREEDLSVVHCKSRVEIEELVSLVGVSESEVTQPSQPTTAVHTNSGKTKEGTRGVVKNTMSSAAAPRQPGGSKGGSSKKQRKSGKTRSTPSAVPPQEIAPEGDVNCLVRQSVKQAWDDCRRSQSRAELGTFFLAGMSECEEGGAKDCYHDNHQLLLGETSKSSGPALLSSLWDPSASSGADWEEGDLVLPSEGKEEEEEEEESREYLRPESVLMMAHQLDERSNRQEDNVADAETLENLAWELVSNATEGRCDTALSLRAESREELDFSDEPSHHLEDSLCADGDGLSALGLFNQQSMSQVFTEMDNELDNLH